MTKGKQDPSPGMSLEELWQALPMFFTEYRPVWAQWYQEERKRLLDIPPTESICEISHVGSTPIPSIWAKPVVDILVEIREGVDMQAIKEHIIRDGYICMMEKAGGTLFNRGYTPPGLAEKAFHLHLREAGNSDELYFRDYMREHPEVAREYEALKLRLWKEYEYDRGGHTEQKTVMVAGFTGDAKTLYPGWYKRQALEFARAEPEDTKALHRFARASEAYWGYDEAFMENFDAGLNVIEGFIRCNPVYAAGDRGCLTAFWGTRQDRDAWELEYFYVVEERLGRGLGKQMWEHMIGWCGEQGIGRIQFATNPQTVGFYGKMGAVQDGEIWSPVDDRPVPRFAYDA